MIKFNLFISFGVLFLVGCSTVYNPATGRNEFIMLSNSAEQSMGAEAHQKIIKQYKFTQNLVSIERIEVIGKKLAVGSDRTDLPYKFYVIENKEANAFTTPGGNIYFNTGLLEKLKTDDQIAYVLAHEIGHVAARHITKKFQARLGYYAVSGIVFSQLKLKPIYKAVASLSTGTLMSIVFARYSRQDEYEADRLSVKYMVLAGYEPKAAIEVLDIFVKEAKEKKGTLLFLRTHPYPEDRIKMIQQLIQGAGLSTMFEITGKSFVKNGITNSVKELLVLK